MKRAAVFALVTVVTAGAVPPAPVSLEVPGRANAAPWVAAAGSFVAVAWGATADGRTDVYAAVSRDGGSTFDSPVRVNQTIGEGRLGGELPPRIALVPRQGAAAPEIVVLYTSRGESPGIKAARSRDGGRTFAPAATLQPAKTPGDRGWPSLAVDRRGTPHAIWLDHRGLAAARSRSSAAAHKHGSIADGVAMAQHSSLYYAAVEAPGEREVAKGVCYCCKTALAAAPDGALYAAWRHVYPGNLRDIALAVSRDGGRTFSAPARVSRDDWAINGCPDDGPALAIDRAGTVHLVWPTVVGGAQPEGAIFYASTRDGVTFTRRARVPTLGSPKPSHPQIAVDPAGRIAVAWDETSGSRRVAAVRRVLPGGDGEIRFGDVVTLGGEAPATYPVLAGTDRGLIAVWSAGGERPVVRVTAIQLP